MRSPAATSASRPRCTTPRASRTSARPAGCAPTNGENLGHLVDGGYFENTGADTLIDLLRYLKQSASPLSVRFIAVVLLNTPPENT